MPGTGEDVLLLAERLGLSDVEAATGNEAVIHEGGVGRGPSSVQTGDDVVLVGEQLAQGKARSSGISLGEISAPDRLVFKGDEIFLFVPVTNNTDSSQDVTLDFTENALFLSSETRTVPAGETKAFGPTVTKSDPGKFNYSTENIDSVVGVTWFDGIEPGGLSADPVLLPPGDPTTLSITVFNRSSGDLDAEVTFREEGGPIAIQTKTVPANGSVDYSTTVTKDSETKREFTATVEELSTGLKGTSNPVTVYWTNDGTSYPGIHIGDSEMKDGPTTFYMGDGQTYPPGTYVLQVDPSGFWAHTQDDSLLFDAEESRFESGDYAVSEPYAIYTSGSVIFGPAIIWDSGPYDTGGGPGTYQSDIFGGGTSGTITLQDSGQIGFFNMDTEGDYSDNRADLTYSLTKLPDDLA